MIKRGHHHPYERAWAKSHQSRRDFAGNNPQRRRPSHYWYSWWWFCIYHPVRRIPRQRCGVSVQVEREYLQGCKKNI